MTIHDHFDGSAHCLECKGYCGLSGDERAVTDLIRWTFEFAATAHDGWMWSLTEEALTKLLGPKRFQDFKQRALITCAQVRQS